MATREVLFATAVNNEAKFYYSYNDLNNRLLSARATNDSAQEVRFRLDYQGQVFQDTVMSGEAKSWAIPGAWGNVNVNQVQFSTEN